MKDIYIFTEEADLENELSKTAEDFINKNFGSATIIATEDNKGVLINEEGDNYMTMESF